jgi:hypothetical protein
MNFSGPESFDSKPAGIHKLSLQKMANISVKIIRAPD